MVRFEIQRSSSASQPYYWRIVAVANGKVLAASETYVNKQDVINAVNLVRGSAAGAAFIDHTG